MQLDLNILQYTCKIDVGDVCVDNAKLSESGADHSLELKLYTRWLCMCMFCLEYRLTVAYIILQNFHIAFECKKAM